jgi:hypothetical protein
MLFEVLVLERRKTNLVKHELKGVLKGRGRNLDPLQTVADTSATPFRY